MTDSQILSRIAVDPAVMVGKPVIRGTRLTVEHILNLLAHSSTIEEVIAEYPGLMTTDVQACILFASKALEDNAFVPIVHEP